MTNKIAPDILRKLLRYDPETGDLFWLPRDAELFNSTKQSKEHNARIWNSDNANKPAFTAIVTGYRHGRIFRKAYLAHRIAWVMYHGEWPEGEIDHVNGDRADNRIQNLRDVTPTINGQNKCIRSDNQSGVTGVCWSKQYSQWMARITVRKKMFRLGTFDRLEDAVLARKDAEKLHGFHFNHGRDSA